MKTYPSPRALGDTLKLGDGFSRYENITGMFLEPGEHVVLVGNTEGKEMRRRPDAGSGDESIRNQLEFVKICCDVSGLDLTDFFDKWGFFWVGDLTVNDYRKYHFTITQQMVDHTKSYIESKKYGKPSEDITLIED